MRAVIASLTLAVLLGSGAATAQDCIRCHEKATPGVVDDWKISKHAREDVECSACHGADHVSANDVSKARIPNPGTCAQCHEARVEEFESGKHALAWVAMNAMPTSHWQPMTLMEGQKGCGGCHKIGTKSESEIRDVASGNPGFGMASCDACHTRHTFSVHEARQPQACQTCHMGFDHAQWEMYSASKHGVRALLIQNGTLPKNTPAPTCQTCHMPDGNHAVRTAWGFLGVRLPLPENDEWADDRVMILKALGVLDPNGEPTKRLEVVKNADVARLSQQDWQKERDRMLQVCETCHSGDFAKGELAKGDDMIRQADRLTAEAIRVVTKLYEDGVLQPPANYASAFPDLLTFHDAPTPIEQRLFVMFLEHRMRAFQGAFHNNPDYSLWYGWSELQRDLTEIRFMAEELRRDKSAAVTPAASANPAPGKQNRK
jgi:hypothetical protein